MIRLRQSIETQMRRRILEPIEVVLGAAEQVEEGSLARLVGEDEAVAAVRH